MLNGFPYSARNPSMYQRAPITFLLQCAVALNLSPDLQTPFQRDGTGPRPSSLKDLDSGHIPASLGDFFSVRYRHERDRNMIVMVKVKVMNLNRGLL